MKINKNILTTVIIVFLVVLLGYSYKVNKLLGSKLTQIESEDIYKVSTCEQDLTTKNNPEITPLFFNEKDKITFSKCVYGFKNWTFTIYTPSQTSQDSNFEWSVQKLQFRNLVPFPISLALGGKGEFGPSIVDISPLIDELQGYKKLNDPQSNIFTNQNGIKMKKSVYLVDKGGSKCEVIEFVDGSLVQDSGENRYYSFSTCQKDEIKKMEDFVNSFSKFANRQ